MIVTEKSWQCQVQLTASQDALTHYLPDVFGFGSDQHLKSLASLVLNLLCYEERNPLIILSVMTFALTPQSAKPLIWINLISGALTCELWTFAALIRTPNRNKPFDCWRPLWTSLSSRDRANPDVTALYSTQFNVVCGTQVRCQMNILSWALSCY